MKMKKIAQIHTTRGARETVRYDSDRAVYRLSGATIDGHSMPSIYYDRDHMTARSDGSDTLYVAVSRDTWQGETHVDAFIYDSADRVGREARIGFGGGAGKHEKSLIQGSRMRALVAAVERDLE